MKLIDLLKQMKWSLGLGLMTAVAPACVPSGNEIEGKLGVEVAEVEESSPLALSFQAAADKYGVPVDLLKALAYSETRLEGAVGEIEFDDQPAPYGLFALRGDELTRAAVLSGHHVDRIIGEDATNIEAAAALLAAYADEAGIDPALRPEAAVWAPALKKWGQIPDDMADHFAEDVLKHVKRGVAAALPDGTTLIIQRHGTAEEAAPDAEIGITDSGLGSSFAVFRSSPNHSARPSARVDVVIIHTCEGAYSGCVSWLRNSAAGVSAHYVVNESGSEISQLVDENRKAWHVAASYRARLNSGQLSSREGQSINNFSIGIEHGGRGAQSRWPEGQINASIRLVRDITARHNIPRDRYHIVGHGQLQPESRSDPGPNWPWSSYLAAINSGSSNPPPSTPPPSNPPPSGTIITVDNETGGRFRSSNNWESSSWADGKVGANYRFRAAAETSDLAEYKVNLPAAGRYEVFARVPGNGYNSNQPYFIYHQGGRAVVNRDLRTRGGSWMSLGTYDFSAGDDWRVAISCWTGGRGWIIADAIRFEAR